MNGIIELSSVDRDEIKRILTSIHEKSTFELKTATALPKSFWETYSSFANTDGGWIILGVKEERAANEIVGVPNAEKVVTDLWNLASNKNKVSFRCIENGDVHVVRINDLEVVLVHVPEAPDSMKPVFINGRISDTYLRTGDGDRKATQEEINALLRNATSGSDGLLLDHFSIQDLDPVSVANYKAAVHTRYPSKGYIEQSDADFLSEIGACVKDRVSGELKIKRGALLFLGKCNSIKEVFPSYHLDFFDRRGDNPRWRDRVSDDEPGENECNLYNFFNIVRAKLGNLLQSSFELDKESQLRLPVSDFDETLRECLVNCLAHADYIQGYPSVKIEAFDGWFRFLNPGKMLVSKEQFIAGGDSRPRNEIVMKLFRLLGASERQGFGGPQIFKSAAEHQFRYPEIETDLEKTELIVWNIDLAESYPSLREDDKLILRLIMKSVSLSIPEIAKLTGITDYKVRKSITRLEEDALIVKSGNGPSTKYLLRPTSMEHLTQLQLAMEQMRRAWSH